MKKVKKQKPSEKVMELVAVEKTLAQKFREWNHEILTNESISELAKIAEEHYRGKV